MVAHVLREPLVELRGELCAELLVGDHTVAIELRDVVILFLLFLGVILPPPLRRLSPSPSPRRLGGGLVGPTFACIIGIQFRNLRKCDRFWYEGGNPLIRFTEAQLDEIRKVSLAKITCDNCDRVTHIQRAMFDVPSIVRC